MSFSISKEDLTLRTNWASIRDATFTAKYHISEKRAVRLVGLFKKVKGHEEQVVEFNDSYKYLFTPQRYAKLSVEYIWYPRVADNVYFFLGGGPAIAVAYRDDGKNHPMFKQYTYGFGASTAVGVEYFVLKNMSIMTEFALSFQFNMKYFDKYLIYDSHNYLIDSDYYSLKSTFLQPFTRFGISFYF